MPAGSSVAASSSPAAVSIAQLARAGFRGEQAGDAACAVAASLGLAAVRVMDAHEHLRPRVARRLEQQHLVAADAGAPVGDGARRRRVDRNRVAALVEHDEIVADPVHLAKGDARHGPLILWRAGRCPTGLSGVHPTPSADIRPRLIWRTPGARDAVRC